MNQTALTIAIVGAIAVLLVGSTVFSNSVQAKKSYKLIVYLDKDYRVAY